MGDMVKRTGLAIGLLFVYPIIEIIVQQKISEDIQPFLPINAINHILKTPNTSLIQFDSPNFDVELQTGLNAQDIFVTLGYCCLFIGISLWVIRKRDI